MNGINFLLDTNAVIYIMQGNPHVRHFTLSENIAVSIITEMELLAKDPVNAIEKEVVSKILKDCHVFDIDLFIEKKAIEIKQQNKVKLPDAIVAATAIQKGLSLVTADKKLKNIPDLDLILIDYE
ncbi:ribonuclease VapC [Bacteroidia bacterium]|nr:ribonuclease VapC [Bacteroidia bacterium]